jgi:hypothetical protein
MNKIVKSPVRCSGYIFALSMAVLFGCTCAALKPAPDPLAGWHFSSMVNLQSNKVIMDDYQDYIQKLPPEEKKYVGPIQYYEDGTGQHAILIAIALNGTDWAHVLIYDKENKRIKILKYVSGHYQS